MKALLYPHGGSGNHGCEAIVRSTLKILGVEAQLFSSNVKEDIATGLDKLCFVTPERNRLSKASLSYWKAFYLYHLLNDNNAFDRTAFCPIIKASNNVDFVLSIGGDNYCYGAPAYKNLGKKRQKRYCGDVL